MFGCYDFRTGFCAPVSPLRLVTTIAIFLFFAALSLTPALAEASPEETAAWESAKKTGDPRLLIEFLNAYPESDYSMEALQQVTVLINGMNAARAALEQNPPRFSTPMRGITDELDGRSIESLLKVQPTYPPILGLPNNLWKNRACSSCHKWKRDNLCRQAQTYQGRDKPDFPHPHGPQFHVVLKVWGETGCQ